ncbi:hypothetical protein PENSPDRAFT_672645 [Peniophora sp. CONT]|nr:hypothetical protein PENSPDRAFT_672645 [Peniophora sp. CONT]
MVMNSTLQTDLASLPKTSSAFFAHFYRAYSRNRSFQLVLDSSNKGRSAPPDACILSAVVFAHSVVVTHTLSVTQLVSTLAQQPRCRVLTELILSPVEDFYTTARRLWPFLVGDKVVSIRAPHLRRLELCQMALDIPETYGLRHLKIDCHRSHDHFITSNAFQPKTLLSILSNNHFLEVIDLSSPISSAHLPDGCNSSIELPYVKEFTLATRDSTSMAWLLSRLVLPPDAYLSLKVGDDRKEEVDILSMVKVAMEFMRYRQFDTLTVIESYYAISLLFSQGPRQWDGRFGSVLPGRRQKTYLPRSGAVDLKFLRSKPSPTTPCWTDVMYTIQDVGFDTSCLTTYEVGAVMLIISLFRGDFHLRKLDTSNSRLRSLFSATEKLRFWPDEMLTVKSSMWQLCAISSVTWSSIAQDVSTLFPSARCVVDARDGSVWVGDTVEDLVAGIRVLPYHCYRNFV